VDFDVLESLKKKNVVDFDVLESLKKKKKMSPYGFGRRSARWNLIPS
jgi:hypothetical protein